jgi:hypothetical protein
MPPAADFRPVSLVTCHSCLPALVMILGSWLLFLDSCITCPLSLVTIYSTFTLIPSEWLENSGAYIHWMVVMPLEKSPFCETRKGYSNT